MEFIGQRVGLHHPDFVIMVGTSTVTHDCLSWTVSDKEEGKSSIEVELDNLDSKYSSVIQLGDPISIRFGLMGEMMAQKVTMKLLKYQETFDRGGVKVKLHGLDDTHQMDNQSGRGQQKGGDVKNNADSVAQNAGIKLEHGTTESDMPSVDIGADEPCARTPMKGTSVRQQVKFLKDQETSGKSSPESISGQYDSKVEGATTGNQSQPKTEQQATGSGVRPGKGGDKDKNRMDNARKRADSKTITGKLTMVGYPMVFAKQGITLLNVGPKASGKWYVSESTNKWSRTGGYSTSCSLLRDSLGSSKGPGESAQPMMLYANITKPGTAYSGPRKIDAPSQATFTWGDGNYIIHFDWQIDLHSNKGQRKKTGGKTVNPDKPKKPVEEKKSPESSVSTNTEAGGAPPVDIGGNMP